MISTASSPISLGLRYELFHLYRFAIRIYALHEDLLLWIIHFTIALLTPTRSLHSIPLPMAAHSSTSIIIIWEFAPCSTPTMVPVWYLLTPPGYILRTALPFCLCLAHCWQFWSCRMSDLRWSVVEESCYYDGCCCCRRRLPAYLSKMDGRILYHNFTYRIGTSSRGGARSSLNYTTR